MNASWAWVRPAAFLIPLSDIRRRVRNPVGGSKELDSPYDAPDLRKWNPNMTVL